MSKAKVYNIKGEEIDQIELNKEIFDVKPNDSLIHQAVKVQLSNARYSISSTKTRGEVAGSGIKPYKQKGTGRARVGDIRPPHWIGGGIAFGPRSNRNWHLDLPKKMRQKAIFVALSEKLKDNKLFIMDKLDVKDHKTKTSEKVLKSLPIEGKNLLVIISKPNAKLELGLANLSYVKILNPTNLSVYDILRYECIIMEKDVIRDLERVFSVKTQNPTKKSTDVKTVSEKEIIADDDKQSITNKPKENTESKQSKKEIIKNKENK